MATVVSTSPGLRSEVEDHYVSYALTMDDKRPNDWVALFLGTGLYAVGTHNNVSTTGMWWYTDRGLGALKERAAYMNGYLRHNPTRTLHTVTNVRARETDDGRIKAEAYVVLYVTDRIEMSRFHVCGRYDDVLTRTDDGLRFVEHRVVLDPETLPGNMGVLL
ncbi:aromatic-ring-hydroxylating dioxygenase subunit beta [Streptomyces sp. NBC_01180]|uniref:aromatic-ring-hydroxylating dioxygenase subunit beta n=1 Tax=Streptomyces sp. NBC_01180 TaxID=2903763 RepID=UPI003867C557|nr:nuclear transport factor 2 family protein [Streptomyces sp. NBC_01180]